MSLRERLIAQAHWANRHEAAVRMAARRVLAAHLEAEDARRRDDEDAYRDALARLETARARWRELTDEGGAS